MRAFFDKKYKMTKKNSHEIGGSQKIKNYRGEVVEIDLQQYMKAWGKSLHTVLKSSENPLFSLFI